MLALQLQILQRQFHHRLVMKNWRNFQMEKKKSVMKGN